MILGKVTILSLIYIIFTSSYSMSHGFFNISAIISFLVIFITTIILLSKWDFIKTDNNSSILYVLLIYSILFSLLFYGGLYQKGAAILISQIILGFALLFSLILLFVNSFKFKFLAISSKTCILYLILAAIVLRLLMVISSPNPQIDAFYQLKEGGFGFVSGKNPYTLIFTRLYHWHESDYFTYLPGILLLTLPSTLLFSDPRISFIVIELLAAYCLYRYLGKNLNASLLSLSFLYSPMSLYVLEQSYADVIIASLLVIFLYFYQKKNNFLAIIIGFLLSTKIVILTTFPIIIRKFKISKKIIVFSLLIFFLITFPFLLWSPFDFLKDTVLIYFSTKQVFLPISLSFPSLLHNFKIPYSELIFTFFLFLLYIWLFFKKNKDVSSIFLSLFLWLFSVSFFSWQAFVNNYYLTGTVLLIAMISLFTKTKIKKM